MVNKNFYADGGTVQATKGAVYLRREADQQILSLCREGTFAYVLTPRQMGKSSLMVNTAERLAEEGVRTAEIDLTRIGVNVTKEEWYLGILFEIWFRLGLTQDVISWWRAPERQELGMAQRLLLFFEQVLLEEISEPIVIFVDEIETTLRQDFTDDFFAAVRSVHNARSKNRFQRLSFVLIGVATPDSLIRDQNLTPFNVGRGVVLSDFTFEEALPLAAGFGLPDEEAQRVMRRVLYWSGGHPFLTQRLCRWIAEEGRAAWDDGAIDELVARVFFGDKSSQDSNLQFVRQMLLTSELNREDVLSTYREILRDRRAVSDEEQSLIKSHLKLSGVVRREGSTLHVRNPIYQQLFNERWVKEHYRVNWLKQLTKVAAGVALLLLFLSAPLAVIAWTQKIKAENNLREANMARADLQSALERETAAKAALQEALARENAAKEAAENSEEEAKAQKVVAENAAKREQQARIQAEARRVEAEKQRSIAEERREEANKLRQIALSREIAASAVSQLPTNPELSVLLASTAIKVKETAQAKDTFRRALVGFRLRNTLIGHKKPVFQARYSPDGKSIVTASEDGTAQVWDAATGQVERSLVGHDDSVHSAEFSRDGKLILTSGDDYTSRVWDASDGRELSVLEGHGAERATAAFSPDSRFVVTAGIGNMARVWDAATGKGILVLNLQKSVATLSPTPAETASVPITPDNVAQKVNVIDEQKVNLPSRISLDGLLPYGALDRAFNFGEQTTPTVKELPVVSAEFSPDGESILTKNVGGLTQVWNAKTGRLLLTLAAEEGSIRGAAFSPDGKLIITKSVYSDSKQEIRIYNVLSGESIFSTSDYSSEHLMPPFDPESKYTLTGGKSNTAVIWDVWRGEAVFVLQGHASPVQSAAFSPDGKFITTTDGTHTARLWDATTGSSLFILQGHTSTVWEASFSPDNKSVITAGGDNTARVWNISNMSWTRPLQDLKITEGGSVAIDPNGKSIAATDGIEVSVYGAATGKELFKLDAGSEAAQLRPAFSPDGKYIITSTVDQKVQVWDAVTGQRLCDLQGHTGEIVSASFSSDARLIVTASEDGTARVWETKTGRGLATLKGHKNTVNGAGFDPTGKYVATISDDNTARVWEVVSGKQIAAFLHLEDVLAGVISPDSKLLATFDSSGKTYVWDLTTCKNLTMLDGVFLKGNAFSPDSRAILTTGATRTLIVSDAASGARLAVLQGHTDVINSAEFSPDGELIVTASNDGTVRLWNAATGNNFDVLREMSVVAGDDNSENDIALASFSRDGRQVITLTARGALQLYNCETCGSLNDLLTLVQSRMTRQLTAQEKAMYLHDSQGK